MGNLKSRQFLIYTTCFFVSIRIKYRYQPGNKEGIQNNL